MTQRPYCHSLHPEGDRLPITKKQPAIPRKPPILAALFFLQPLVREKVRPSHVQSDRPPVFFAELFMPSSMHPRPPSPPDDAWSVGWPRQPQRRPRRSAPTRCPPPQLSKCQALCVWKPHWFKDHWTTISRSPNAKTYQKLNVVKGALHQNSLGWVVRTLRNSWKSKAYHDAAREQASLRHSRYGNPKTPPDVPRCLKHQLKSCNNGAKLCQCP